MIHEKKFASGILDLVGQKGKVKCKCFKSANTVLVYFNPSLDTMNYKNYHNFLSVSENIIMEIASLIMSKHPVVLIKVT